MKNRLVQIEINRGDGGEAIERGVDLFGDSDDEDGLDMVAKDPTGKEINALEQHIKNLLCPSTPFFFNTLYDPYREGADFVCGYPFSLREGVPTTVSHGIWLNIPDYDATTQLVKPLERNTR
ncbi:hypothetical protein CQW23_24033 [Capsicum baccatum]|uniref:Uncharacterized protein n=1 Tax=Capsicum baccatum TaxID=33114 RepID=A0A2G2VTQ6_CAPBA|nr:hypothetical protein CQW23_24033 [Capsicum baccatum]